MRRALVALAFVVGCSGADGGAVDLEPRDGSVLDASNVDGPAIDTFVALDTSSPIDTAVAIDAAVVDTKPTPDGGCRTSCVSVECGTVPDWCGGFFKCEPCSDPKESCYKVSPPVFQNGVRNAIEAVKATKPSFINPDDAMGDSVRVTDTVAFVKAVVAEMAKKTTIVVIPDPNDAREIRVRDKAGDLAENYLTVTSGGYSAYKYTSSCTPAGF